MTKRRPTQTDSKRGDRRRTPSGSNTPPSVNLDAEWLKRFRNALTRWYSRQGRDLPWRRSRDPYPIWISEIMLQQTTVAAVIPYFERFLQRFPTLDVLARADEHDVLRHWEGLGYYSRARNIHKTARVIVESLAGNFPQQVPELLDLPGIGRYTAGAVASFAFDRRAPILEANTLRLYCRLLGYTGDPRSKEGQELLWHFAEEILPKRQPGQFNQALMELGQTVCSPVRPACENCPVNLCCGAFARGLQETIPQPVRKPEITAVTETSVIVRRGSQCLLVQRQPGERWAGLWDFLRFEGDTGDVPPGEIPPRVRATTGLEVAGMELLTEIRHSVTRFRITLRCYTAESRRGKARTEPREHRWVPVSELQEYPLSVTGRKLARLLEEKSSNPKHTP